MKEFNYNRAWEEFVRPEFTKLMPAVLTLVQSVAEAAPSLEQEGASRQLRSTPPGLVETLVKQLDEIPVEELAWASRVVYYFGHLDPSGSASQESGSYWKFEMLAVQSVLGREGNEALRLAKLRMDEVLKEYHDHKEGTEYSNDELAGLIQRLLPEVSEMVEVVEAQNVNFKPHPFVIGTKHFPTDGGMFIDPHRAPCAMKGCNLSYEEHTCDRALLVRPKVDLKEEAPVFQEALKKILAVLEENSIKIDGFALLGPEGK